MVDGVIFAGLMAGLHPVSFITTASPHLGIRGLLPSALERVLRAASYGGRTAKQVFGGVALPCKVFCKLRCTIH